MTVVDAYLGFCLEKRKFSCDEDDSFLSFVDILAHDLINLDQPVHNDEDVIIPHNMQRLSTTVVNITKKRRGTASNAQPKIKSFRVA